MADRGAAAGRGPGGSQGQRRDSAENSRVAAALRWEALQEFDAQVMGLPSAHAGAARYLLAGMDEAGRGPLAGPVVAAAVVLRPGARLPGLDDSKVLRPSLREEIFRQVLRQAAVGTGLATAREIDTLGIQAACGLAMRRAWSSLPVQPWVTLVDGPWAVPGLAGFQVPVIDGDARSAAVAAASVVAKVYRDWLMRLADLRWPAYGFARHKGYGTADHFDALRRYGPCPLHRRSFLSHLDGQPEAVPAKAVPVSSSPR